MSRRTKVFYPIQEDWKGLSKAFNSRAKGNYNECKEAIKTINKFDNRFGTDFIGMVALDSSIKVRNVRKAEFNTQKLIDIQEALFKLSKAFPESAAKKLARESKPTQTKPEREIIRPVFGERPASYARVG